MRGVEGLWLAADDSLIDCVQLEVRAGPIDSSGIEYRIARLEAARLRPCGLDDSDRVIAKDPGLPLRGLSSGANFPIHRIDRDGLYPNEQIVRPKLGRRQLDIDERILR